jgi:hypothetical protein
MIYRSYRAFFILDYNNTSIFYCDKISPFYKKKRPNNMNKGFFQNKTEIHEILKKICYKI